MNTKSQRKKCFESPSLKQPKDYNKKSKQLISQCSDKSSPRKLSYELQISQSKLQIKSLNNYTSIFIQKSWNHMVEKLYNEKDVTKFGLGYVVFNESFLLKQLKEFMKKLDNKLKNVRHSSSCEMYFRGLKENLEKLFSVKICVPVNRQEQPERIPYKQFVHCFQILELPKPDIQFQANNSNPYKKPLNSHNHRHRHIVRQDQVQFRLSKVELVFFYDNENHSKIKQMFTNLQQHQEQWLLYPMNPYLNQFSLDKIYYEELIQKILIKRQSKLIQICTQAGLEIIQKSVKLLKQDMINLDNSNPAHPHLQKDDYFLAFHVFGQTKNYFSFYNQLNEFFESCRLWILRPEKICCCQSLVEVQTYLKTTQQLDAFLISDHIIVAVKTFEEMNELTSLKLRKKFKQKNQVSQEDRLLKILQTGTFLIDRNDYDPEDLRYIYKMRQGYKEFLQKEYSVKITYKPQTSRQQIVIQCQIAAFRTFKGCIYSYINDMRAQKEQLKEFISPFHRYVFDNFLRPELQKQFPQVKFVTKKKKSLERIWVKFHAKDRSELMEKIHDMRKKIETDIDYIVCKRQPISQNWFMLYRRPQILSVQTLTCRKYLISKDTRVYVLPYQALSRQVEEMLFLIDQNFENCWEFTEIAERNDINLMSLFLQFQQRKKKKPDRIKSIPLKNHRYINRIVVWYNDMLKKIENRRQQDIKKLYKRYQQKQQLHIMIPRHAATNILLHFVLPSFIKQFTQQTGYNLKQIFFYYPILFDDKHSHIQDLTMKVIDEQMRRANIQLVNQNFMTKETIKKISQMDYVVLQCGFQGDSRMWKASSLSSYVFFVERALILQKKQQLLTMIGDDVENQHKLLNFKIPLFFMDASFNNEIIVDLIEGFFYRVSKLTIEGPFEIKADKKYEEISKAVSCIRFIFKSLSYVVLYVDKDFHVSKNGYYYSHRHYLKQVEKENRNKKSEQANFKKKKVEKIKQINDSAQQNINAASQITPSLTTTLYPMKLVIQRHESRRSYYEHSGRILKRQSKQLNIQILQSELATWFMCETYKDKLPELEQYLKNTNNYRNNEDNFLLQDISQYSILDLKEENYSGKLFEFGIDANKNNNKGEQHSQSEEESQVSKQFDHGWKLADQSKNDLRDSFDQKSIDSIDISGIFSPDFMVENTQNNLSDKNSIMEHFNVLQQNTYRHKPDFSNPQNISFSFI